MRVRKGAIGVYDGSESPMFADLNLREVSSKLFPGDVFVVVSVQERFNRMHTHSPMVQVLVKQGPSYAHLIDLENYANEVEL